MSTASTKKLKGFAAIGSEAPYLHPDGPRIVGLDVRETAENWFAQCARVKDESDADLGEYAAEILAAADAGEPIVSNVVICYKDGDQAVVLDGRRTVRAARLAAAEQARRRVPVDKRVIVRVVFKQGTPEELFRHNVDAHKAKPLTRMQTARTVLSAYKHCGEDAARTAALFGKTPKYVSYHLALLDLSSTLQKKVDAGDVPVREVAKLAKLPREEQDAAYAALEAAGATRGAAAKNGIDHVVNGKLVGKADKTRMVSGNLLKRWREEIAVKPHDHVDPVELLDFILGRKDALPQWMRETLAAVGWKFKS